MTEYQRCPRHKRWYYAEWGMCPDCAPARCEVCRYYRAADPVVMFPGFCLRYPEKLAVHAGHWCGEWRAL